MNNLANYIHLASRMAHIEAFEVMEIQTLAREVEAQECTADRDATSAPTSSRGIVCCPTTCGRSYPRRWERRLKMRFHCPERLARLVQVVVFVSLGLVANMTMAASNVMEYTYDGTLCAGTLVVIVTRPLSTSEKL